MIIFDLDGTLANYEHRRHFIDPYKNEEYEAIFPHIMEWNAFTKPEWVHKETGKKWRANWPEFYQACYEDTVIESVKYVLDIHMVRTEEIEIWSGRCEYLRSKTEQWISKNIRDPWLGWNFPLPIKMRPIGNTEPDEVLKERWLDEAIADGTTIDYVFDSHPKSIRMWRRRGIFLFNCCQQAEEF